jgi:tRNA-splicing ligase RtcB (3'-phosphate/5'-hydroxy nucleic acid ligase)
MWKLADAVKARATIGNAVNSVYKSSTHRARCGRRMLDEPRPHLIMRKVRRMAWRPRARVMERSMKNPGYEVMNVEGGRHVKMWTHGVPVDELARQQLANIARMPFVRSHLAVMPDVHVGKGATVGSVIATKGAIIPAAVGVDIGCGMMAVQTTLTAQDLPDSLAELRARIERAVPHGTVTTSGRAHRGAWTVTPDSVRTRWQTLAARHDAIVAKYPSLAQKEPHKQLGTLGGGNHFIEVCLDTDQAVWVMLHSGSRGIGNLIGQLFIELARKDMQRHFINLPDRDLAYLVEGTKHFDDYVEAMTWAQDYAAHNRRSMMDAVLRVMRETLPPFQLGDVAVNCHHNYCTHETHFGEDLIVTRKGAVSAKRGELGIIPGSMGARSYIVRGRGNPDSFMSCSHGAGRVMSRTAAQKCFTVADHEAATRGVECRKDSGVIDETPAAYKDIDAVMAAQRDLVEVAYTLKQVLCVKG